MVLFELPFLDGVLVHEPLRLFEGDALLVVGGGRIVGDGQQSADAFHDSFRIHICSCGSFFGSCLIIVTCWLKLSLQYAAQPFRA